MYDSYEEIFVSIGRGYGGGGDDLALLYTASDDEEMYDLDGDLIAPQPKKARVCAPEEENVPESLRFFVNSPATPLRIASTRTTT